MWIKSREEQKLSTYIVDYQQKLLITLFVGKIYCKTGKKYY